MRKLLVRHWRQHDVASRRLPRMRFRQRIAAIKHHASGLPGEDRGRKGGAARGGFQGEGTNFRAATRLCATALSSLAAAYALSTCQPQQQSLSGAALRCGDIVALQRNVGSTPCRSHTPTTSGTHPDQCAAHVAAWSRAQASDVCGARPLHRIIRCVGERDCCIIPLSPACKVIHCRVAARAGNEGGGGARRRDLIFMEQHRQGLLEVARWR